MDDAHYHVLRLLDASPRLTQRELARELGVSLGHSKGSGFSGGVSHGVSAGPRALGTRFCEEAIMKSRQISKLVHEGNYVAEVDVQMIVADDGWAPYLSVEDTMTGGRLKRLAEYVKCEDAFGFTCGVSLSY